MKKKNASAVMVLLSIGTSVGYGFRVPVKARRWQVSAEAWGGVKIRGQGLGARGQGCPYRVNLCLVFSGLGRRRGGLRLRPDQRG